MIYTHVHGRGPGGVRSPLDRLTGGSPAGGKRANSPTSADEHGLPLQPNSAPVRSRRVTDRNNSGVGSRGAAHSTRSPAAGDGDRPTGRTWSRF